MASLARLLRRETRHALRSSVRARAISPFLEKFPHDRSQRTLTTGAVLEDAQSSSSTNRRVAVFWDLDNKPPRLVRPFEAATRLKAMAAAFGEVVDVVAYANHHAFEHVPSWIHEERRQRKELDRLEASGALNPKPYVCGVCGAKAKTHVLLTKHFRMLHEREQRKRVNRLESLRGKKRQKERFREANSEKMSKYREAAQSVLVPKVGYGLMQEIRRAGVYVRTVKDQPQAADVALKDHIRRSMKKGVKCICLVSDDTDFKADLNFAREKKLHVIVVGDLKILSAYADTYFSWRDVASGRAEEEARRLNGKPSLGEPGSGASGMYFEGSEVAVEDESEWDADDDEEWGEVDEWRPIDRYADLRFEEEHDYVGDSLSESESDVSDVETDHRAAQGFHQHWPKASSGRRGVRLGLRTFTTSSRGEKDVPTPPETEGEAVLAEDAGLRNPQRLHYFFTKLEGANVQFDSSKSKLDSNGGNDPRHFTRVQDILKPPLGEEAPKLGKPNSRYDEKSRESVSKKEEAYEQSAPAGGGQILDGAQNDETSTSPADGVPRDETRKPKRRTMRRGPAMKSRVTKVVNSGPRPFYLSGFASESQAQCNAITRYHKEWWSGDEDGDTRKTQRKRREK